MPRTYRKSNRRRPRRRFKKKLVPRPRLPLNGQRHSETIRLRYAQHIDMTNSNSEAYQFRANSLYDPDYTSTVTAGHQPMGFDQMALKYNHYLVLGARIKVTPVITGDTHSSGDDGSYVCVELRDNAQFDVTTTEHMLETKPYSKNAKMIVNNYMSYMSNTDTKTISAYYSPSKMFGKSKMLVKTDETLKSSVDTNPNEDAIFQITAYPIGTLKDSIKLLVEIDYVAVFFEPRELPQSN